MMNLNKTQVHKWLKVCINQHKIYTSSISETAPYTFQYWDVKRNSCFSRGTGPLKLLAVPQQD